MNSTRPATDDGFVPLAQIANKPGLDLAAIREKLAGSYGRQYWRSLDEVANTDEFQAYLRKEFPNQAPRDMAPVSRREFFRLMGATLALAGVGGCAMQPKEQIVPYIEQPEHIVPGKPLYYSSAYVRSGYAYGVLGETHMGRPVKLEGNPEHPGTLGSSDIFTQASILTLYDPDRSQSARYLGGSSAWEAFLMTVARITPTLQQRRGAGLRILVGTVTSPTLTAQLRRLQAAYPEARIHQHEAVSQENVLAGGRLAFGQEVQPVYRFDQADRILSLDDNFLAEDPGSVRYAREFINGRRVREALRQGKAPEMNRLYVIESTPTITGAKADHALRLRPSQIEAVARAIANKLGIAGAGSASLPAGVDEKWIDALVADLQERRGASVVTAGAGQPPVVHALAAAMNNALGAVGKTVTYVAPVETRFGGTLKQLVDDINAGQVEALIILGGNPVYTAPADIPLSAALDTLNGQESALQPGSKKLTIHLGLYDDETGIRCAWHLPESHFLEAWSDARAYDGTASIVQPLITPLYDTHSAHELISALVDPEPRDGYALIREQWMGTNPTYSRRRASAQPGAAVADPTGASSKPVVEATEAFERFWHQVLTNGVVPNTKAPARTLAIAGNFATPPAPAAQGFDIVFRPDPTIWDGCFANNGWLQELPKPLSVLAWDNAALVSPATAEALKVRDRDLVEITFGGRKLKVPVWINPGHPNETVTLSLGYGRDRAGRVGNKTGFNAYLLRTSDALGFGTGAQVTKVNGTYDLVGTQHHFSMEGRDIVRVGTLHQLEANPKSPSFMHPVGVHTIEGRLPSLYPQEWPSDRQHPETAGNPEHGTEHHEGQQGKNPGLYEAKKGRAYRPEGIPAWGMVIDQAACIGCNTCTIACQAENNIATVGKDQVKINREMHWIRIDTYFTGELDKPDPVFQPVPCMHCEKAPCEPVCPVEATSHSAEGLNEMTYNRCIGTRYCSNNCPYKVRRFNFLQFSDQKTPQIQLMRNPDVTVRSRGVMEKCTFCVQRINWARIEAEKEERPIKDGDVLTACQQACPTGAIVFGDINDTRSNGGKGSMVRQYKSGALDYSLLAELGTQPRTTYLPAMRNPNPVIEPPKADAHGGGHGAQNEGGHSVGGHDASGGHDATGGHGDDKGAGHGAPPTGASGVGEGH